MSHDSCICFSIAGVKQRIIDHKKTFMQMSVVFWHRHFINVETERLKASIIAHFLNSKGSVQ